LLRTKIFHKEIEMMKSKTIKLVGVVLAISMMAGGATAQNWPKKTIRVVAAVPPGTPGDLIMRAMQADLQKDLGQTVVVDNKPGAGGNLAAQEVARATDDHTFLVGPDTMLTINPFLYTKLGFSPLQDLVPVTQLGRTMQMLVCNPGAGIRTLADFTVRAKAKEMTYASGGQGAPGHMAMEMLMADLGIKMVHVPYKGPGPAMLDVMAGQVPCGFLASGVVAPMVKSGKLVALGASAIQRTDAAAEVPTIAEQGVKGFDASFFEILAAPKGMPPEFVKRFQQAVVTALQLPEVRQRLLASDIKPIGNTPDLALERTRADAKKWSVVADKLGIQLD
jgi:tripartite-type tricarboxylate transporter receptor subunit TctC